jgi:DNA-binding CsgD family transcriptional regulator
MRVSRPSGRLAYEVLVAPIAPGTFGFAFTGPLAVLFVRDPEADITAPLERLRHRYALTGAEARVMHAMLCGDTLDDAADRFGLSKETLRSQLKAVYLKTETSNQLELLRLGLRGMAAFSE